MNNTALAWDIHLPMAVDAAIDRVTEALQAAGFGVLTRIDVHTTLKVKIDVDFRPYVILGACNPRLAHRALTAAPDIGIMLPCNVTVEQGQGDTSLVRITDPWTMLRVGEWADRDGLRELAHEAGELLGGVAASLRAEAAEGAKR